VPEGLARVLDIMQSAITPKEGKAEPPEDDEDVKKDVKDDDNDNDE
jgi:hypothetical protein